MTIKGYVVRWRDGAPKSWESAALADSVEEYCSLRGAGASDARIFSVADDGTETALPTYEEALAQVERLAARIEAMLEDPEGVDALSDECAAAVDAEANRAWWRTCNTHKGTDAERHEAARLASRAVYQKARRAMIDAWARGEQKGPQS